MDFSREKNLVRQYIEEFDKAEADSIQAVTELHFTSDAKIYACYPFDQEQSPAALTTSLWQPLKNNFTALHRRQDVFMAGINEADGSCWVMSMGHYMGLFDKAFLKIPPTGKLTMLRYAEFFKVEDNKITAHAVFMDWIALMKQAGLNPLPAETGNSFVYPGPMHHNGLLFDQQDPGESAKTLALVNQMVADLDQLNKSGNDQCPPELLARCWSPDMLWYGPAGIGASYTIKRYQQQHQYPFRQGLKDKVFNGHVCRFAEGEFACFFGWPNLSNTPGGGFLGLPASNIRADMRVVDVYSRQGNKLAENWVFMDIPYWLKQQGLDVLARTTSI